MNRHIAIPGVNGNIQQFIRAANRYEELFIEGREFTMRQKRNRISDYMGRNFEASRLIWFADRGALLESNSTSPLFDFRVTNFGPIEYVEVKWSSEGIGMLKADEVVRQARNFKRGTFLLEANQIRLDARLYLEDHGGIELEFGYPH